MSHRPKAEHSLARVLVQVEQPSLAAAQRMPQRLNEDWQTRLRDVVAATLSRWSSHDAEIVLPRVELDIGVLRREDWESELLEKLSPLLLDALGRPPRDPPPRSREPMAATVEDGVVARLIARLSAGIEPWWAHDDGMTTEALLREVSAEHSDEFSRWLEGDGDRPEVWQRLAEQTGATRGPATLRSEREALRAWFRWWVADAAAAAEAALRSITVSAEARGSWRQEVLAGVLRSLAQRPQTLKRLRDAVARCDPTHPLRAAWEEAAREVGAALPLASQEALATPDAVLSWLMLAFPEWRGLFLDAGRRVRSTPHGLARWFERFAAEVLQVDPATAAALAAAARAVPQLSAVQGARFLDARVRTSEDAAGSRARAVAPVSGEETSGEDRHVRDADREKLASEEVAPADQEALGARAFRQAPAQRTHTFAAHASGAGAGREDSAHRWVGSPLAESRASSWDERAQAQAAQPLAAGARAETSPRSEMRAVLAESRGSSAWDSAGEGLAASRAAACAQPERWLTALSDDSAEDVLWAPLAQPSAAGTSPEDSRRSSAGGLNSQLQASSSSDRAQEGALAPRRPASDAPARAEIFALNTPDAQLPDSRARDARRHGQAYERAPDAPVRDARAREDRARPQPADPQRLTGPAQGLAETREPAGHYDHALDSGPAERRDVDRPLSLSRARAEQPDPAATAHARAEARGADAQLRLGPARAGSSAASRRQASSDDVQARQPEARLPLTAADAARAHEPQRRELADAAVAEPSLPALQAEALRWFARALPAWHAELAEARDAVVLAACADFAAWLEAFLERLLSIACDRPDSIRALQRAIVAEPGLGTLQRAWARVRARQRMPEAVHARAPATLQQLARQLSVLPVRPYAASPHQDSVLHDALLETPDATALRALLVRADLSQLHAGSLLRLALACAPARHRRAWRACLARWEHELRGCAARRKRVLELRRCVLLRIAGGDDHPPGPWLSREQWLRASDETCAPANAEVVSTQEAAAAACEALLAWGVIGTPREVLRWRAGERAWPRFAPSAPSSWREAVRACERSVPPRVRRAWSRSAQHLPAHDALVAALDADTLARVAAWSPAAPRSAERVPDVVSDRAGHNSDLQHPVRATRGLAALGPLRTRTSGLVLLHPFLPMFVSRLGLWNEATGFTSAAAHVRAAQLLHSLASGRESAREVDLTLEKLVCGVPPSLPVAEAWSLSPEEKQLGEGLLEAAIEHWGSLGHTSIEGLRGSFLCRAGLLKRRSDERWELTVDKRTWDVLLSTLPWSLSMFTLPWLEQPFHVRWI